MRARRYSRWSIRFAVEPVRQRGKAAADTPVIRSTVEQPHRTARAGDLDAPERLESAERERRDLRDRVAGQPPAQRRIDCRLIPSVPRISRGEFVTRTQNGRVSCRLTLCADGHYCVATHRRAARAFTSRIQIGAALLRPLDGVPVHSEARDDADSRNGACAQSCSPCRQHRADLETQRR